MSVGRQIVVIKEGIIFNALILILTPAKPSHGKKRDLPGGELRLGEDPLVALRREVLEETGLSIVPVSPVRIWSFLEDCDTHFIGITFACRSLSARVQLSTEHVAYSWLTQEEVPVTWAEREELLAIFECVKRGAPRIAGTSIST